MRSNGHLLCIDCATHRVRVYKRKPFGNGMRIVEECNIVQPQDDDDLPAQLEMLRARKPMAFATLPPEVA